MWERTGGVDDEHEISAAAAGGGGAVRDGADGAGLRVGVRGGTRQDQRRPRRSCHGHGFASTRGNEAHCRKAQVAPATLQKSTPFVG
jgi:hypothetical protein